MPLFPRSILLNFSKWVDTMLEETISQVLPGLFMGGAEPTKDEALLRSHKITLVISVGQRPLRKFPGIRYAFLEAEDSPEFPIREIFPESSRMIEREREAGGAVYVHCKMGVSRSAAVVIAYLMVKERTGYQGAFDKLKQIRESVQPNEGFVRQLEEFEMDITNQKVKFP